MEYDKVECPYCNKQLGVIQHTHLKTHNKTMQDLKKDFPNCQIQSQKVRDMAKEGGSKNKETWNEEKIIFCIYCQTEMKVPKNTGNKQACKSCLDKGLENPDGRTKINADLKRQQTLQKKYGVTNIAHISGVIEKRSETNEKLYGGTGFASEDLARKTRQTIKEKYGAENIMKTEEGIYRLIKGLKQKYGKEVTNIQHIFEIKQKVSETLKEFYKNNSQPSKGKNYIEMYGEDAANKLIELRRESGYKGFEKSLELGYGPSKPQLQLFELVKQIIPEVKMEFGQNLSYNDERYYYFLDIAIPELKINIEYDCSWTHPDPEKDKFRDDVLKSFGWKVIRYFERIPTLEELQKDINNVL